jgi:hypothetical protein
MSYTANDLRIWGESELIDLVLEQQNTIEQIKDRLLTYQETSDNDPIRTLDSINEVIKETK